MTDDITTYVTSDPEKRFTGLPLCVKYIDGTNWELVQDASYRLKSGAVSTVHKGFRFDFASVPRCFWWLLPPTGVGGNAYGIATLWHDWLCEHRQIEGKTCTALEADRLFLEIMLYVGVRKVIANTMYSAVRLAHVLGWTKWGDPVPDDAIKENAT